MLVRRSAVLSSSRIRLSRPVLNIAHRGASGRAPENTLAAVHAAIEDGADLVELDVRRTRDGALVLMHDSTLDRTTDARWVYPRRAPWRVADFTLDQIRLLDAGAWKGRAFTGERVPTLEEVLWLLEGTGVGLLLEVKKPGLYPGIVREVGTALWSEPGFLVPAVRAGRMIVQSFDIEAMKEHKVAEPAIPVGLLGCPPVGHLPVLATWADQVNPRHSRVDDRYVAQVHLAGMTSLVWTVNRARGMRRAINLGADGLITNRPGRLTQLLGPNRSAARERGGPDEIGGEAVQDRQQNGHGLTVAATPDSEVNDA